MRVVIITVIVWAIIIGFFVSGVRVMATSPDTIPVQSEEWTAARNLRQINLERARPSGEPIRPSGGQERVIETVSPD